MTSFLTAPLRIAVCDDDPPDRQLIAQLTHEILAHANIPCEVILYSSATQLLDAISSGAQFAILLLDVLMEQLDGMDLAARLREREDRTAIIFISCNREMALRGYEVEAVRYLAKPLDRGKLREALLFCCRMGRDRKELLLPTPEGRSRIRPCDLVYVETWNRGVMLHLKNGKRECSVKISELVDVLPEGQFVFCHRTILVNLAFVRSIRRCELELEEGKTLPISKYRQRKVKEKLMRYLDT